MEIKKVWCITYVKSFLEEKVIYRLRKFGAKVRTPGVDMMGYVIRRTYTIIRGKIFIRIRRQFMRAKRELKKLGYIPYWRAYKLIAYNGWLENSDSLTFKRKYDVYNIRHMAEYSLSRHSRKLNKQREVYINERKLYPAT